MKPKYEVYDDKILKDGHTMFPEDVCNDIQSLQNKVFDLSAPALSDRIDSRVGISPSMTNTELSKAIDRAHNSAGQASEQQKLWFAHLKNLLTIQRLRAETIEDSND